MKNVDFLEETKPLDSEALATLQGKLKSLTDLRQQVKVAEQALKDLKERERKFSEEEVPNYLLQFGMRKIELASGEQVSVTEDLRLSVPKTDPIKRKKALQFLIKQGGGGLIKDTLVVEDPTVSLMEKLDEEETSYARKQDVNASSLKAFMRGLLGMKKNTMATISETDVPEELNLYVFKKTAIKGVK